MFFAVKAGQLVIQSAFWSGFVALTILNNGG